MISNDNSILKKINELIFNILVVVLVQFFLLFFFPFLIFHFNYIYIRRENFFIDA